MEANPQRRVPGAAAEGRAAEYEHQRNLQSEQRSEKMSALMKEHSELKARIEKLELDLKTGTDHLISVTDPKMRAMFIDVGRDVQRDLTAAQEEFKTLDQKIDEEKGTV